MQEEKVNNPQEKTDLKGKPIPQEPVIEEKETTVEQTPEKKKSGCAKGCLIVSLVLLFILALLAGGIYFGYTRVLKAMEPVDLGIEYTEQDYIAIMNEIGLDADGSLLCIDCPSPVFTDPHEVEVSVSSARASAAFEYINQHLTNASISGTQIKMGEGMAELSTTLTFQGRTFPIYMVGSISKATNNSIDGEISTIKAGALTVPDTVTSYVADFLLGTANDKLEAAGDTVRIDDIDIKPEGLNFKGLVPTKAQ
jgi:hypothetical protein